MDILTSYKSIVCKKHIDVLLNLKLDTARSPSSTFLVNLNMQRVKEFVLYHCRLVLFLIVSTTQNNKKKKKHFHSDKKVTEYVNIIIYINKPDLLTDSFLYFLRNQ